MKKALLLVLALSVMAVSMLGGCSGTAPASSQTTENAAEDVENLDNGGDKTIGVVFYSKTDALGSVVYALVNEAAKAWGVNVKWEIGGLDNDTQLKLSAESDFRRRGRNCYYPAGRYRYSEDI